MEFQIGKNVKQKGGFSAFIPEHFPPRSFSGLSKQLQLKASEAERLVGKLDGITDTLPDINFFLKMFAAKEATYSSQIEGTRATLIDSLEKDIGIAEKDTDADDILFYLKALEYGIKRIKKFPLSLRFIRELHKISMTGARSSQFADPGSFRNSQNYIGGTKPENASFVPPPKHEMQRALGDLELYLHNKKDFLPIIHIGLAHSQFETIHPFLDGNGRTGRLLITLLMYERGILERPVLYLSEYFKKHQKAYYSALDSYHHGSVEDWLVFFTEGVIQTAGAAINTCKKVIKLRDQDMEKIMALGRRESESGVLVLRNLYAKPIVTSKSVMKWTGFTRSGAQRVIDRFVKLEILKPREKKGSYDRSYGYDKYLNIFVRP